MDDIDLMMKKYEEEKKMKYEKFMNTCKNKMNDGELIYRAMALFIAKKYGVSISTYPSEDVASCVYVILNYFIEEVEDMDFESWLNRNDGPFIRRREELRKIFPEFKFIKEDDKLLEVVNTIYDLDLELCDEYFYTLSMDFESFTPIDVNEIFALKEDIRILKKYNYPTEELEEKLKKYGLSDEEIDLL